MRFLRYFILIILLISLNSVFAQTYLVTSNADSGPGTLREGLLNAAIANRSTPYIINFQLSGNPNDNANRTIRLRSVLPVVSSNVIIDGSSQTGWPALGNSGAKIILEPEYVNSTFSGLIIGQPPSTNEQTTNVEIYGLYIRNFATINNLQNVNLNQGSGIVLDYRANNITIGAPGKGNVIGGNINGILIQNSYNYGNINPLSNIKIQSNLIGVIYDGVTANTNVYGISASLYECSLNVGGDNSGEGNVIAANRVNLDIKRYYTVNTRFDINIINNKIGVDFSGQTDFHELPIFLSSSSLEIAGLKVDASNTALYVRNNIIGGNRTVGVSITNADFILTGNAIGTNTNGSINLGNGIGIKTEANSTGIIGGATDAEKNLIANNNFGIETVSSKPVKITRNSMYCNRVFGIGKTLTILQPYVQILKQRADHVSGKATPNSEIELFYTQNCQGICEGKTYISTVQTGSDGRWEYNGSLSQNVTATASLLNATTSPFSTAELLPNEAVIQPLTCNNKGSITIPEQREGFTFSWVRIETDGTRTPLGNSQSINGLEVGTYEVTINDGCKPFPNVFIIKDQKLTQPVIKLPTPSCGQTNFSFLAEVLRGSGTLRYQWFNENDVAVSTVNPAVLPEGTYYVEVTDGAGCKLKSAPVTINRKPQPKIINTGIRLQAAACGEANGAITGISIGDNTGTASYKWFKHDPVTGIIGATEISTSLDLANAEGGAYTLFVYDQGQCSPVPSGPYVISTYNKITISNGSIKPASCALNNGMIGNVIITEADRYEWLGPTGVSIKSGIYAPGVNIGISDLVPGAYTLKASNSVSGCAMNKSFVVQTQIPQIYDVTNVIIPTTCELTNGSVSLNFNSPVPSRYEWKNEAGALITGTVTEIKNLSPSNYRLYAYDNDNCLTVLGPFAVTQIPKLVIEPNSGKINNDGCSLRRGSIKDIIITGGVQPYVYKWTDASGQTIQNTHDLINVGAGTYRLEVKDGSSCGYAISQEYIIEDLDFPLLEPVVKDMRICYVSEITIPVIHPEEGTYQLLYEEDDINPFMESITGTFSFKISKTADYYIRRKLGDCISPITKFHIEVTHDNLEIGNVMTPNNDGLNDVWMLKGLPDYAGNNIKIFTRSGQLIYEATGNYTKPFDGMFRGKELPAGNYFYIIDLRSECKPISGTITLLR